MEDIIFLHYIMEITMKSISINFHLHAESVNYSSGNNYLFLIYFYYSLLALSPSPTHSLWENNNQQILWKFSSGTLLPLLLLLFVIEPYDVDFLRFQPTIHPSIQFNSRSPCVSEIWNFIVVNDLEE